MCLSYCAFLRWKTWEWLELDSKGVEITCPVFGLYSSPAEHPTMGYCFGLDESCGSAKIAWAVCSTKETCNFCTIRAKVSISSWHTRLSWRWWRQTSRSSRSCYCLWRWWWTIVSEDEGDELLAQSTSRTSSFKEKREYAAECSIPTPLRRRKGPLVWRDAFGTLEQDVSGNSRERSEEVSILSRNPDGEALRNIIHEFERLSPETLPHDCCAVQEELGHLHMENRMQERKWIMILAVRSYDVKSVYLEFWGWQRVW